MTRIGVVGAGRVGAVLAARLRRAGHEVSAVAGESDASRARIAALLPGVEVAKPTAVARGCDLLLLTVPDDMLDNVTRMLVAAGAIRPGQYVVHTSGRHGLGVLEPAAGLGAHCLAVHPAMTFTGAAQDAERLTGCVFGVTAEPADARTAAELVADLGGTMLPLTERQRLAYHVALTHGANHLLTLVGQAMDLLGDLGAPDPAGTLRPLLTAALDNALTAGDAALTGPIVRGDLRTLAAHLDWLAAWAPDTLESYLALGRATANRAVVAGTLSPALAADAVATLNQARRVTPA